MRSSKSRSRNKSNRNRSIGNIVNRVFDSSGPEGKVRGTPQQIIDKYTQLARDAQLSNDRVAAENFQQHAEHYTRMLGEAMREQEARRETQEGGHGGNGNGGQNRPRSDRDMDRDMDRDVEMQDPSEAPQPDYAPSPSAMMGESDVIDMAGESDSGLVETPETSNAPKPRQQRRPRRQKQPQAEGGSGEAPSSDQPQEAAG